MTATELTILAVDDEYANLFLLENLLVGFRVITASSGREMWETLESDLPDLILLDVMMPERDGVSLAQELSSNERFEHIPIIFVTAKDSGEDVARGLAAGGVDYVRKPIDEVELRARITVALRRAHIEAKLRLHSSRDALTGLHNRRHFIEVAPEKVAHHRRHGKGLSLSLVDLDHFKNINDTYGHTAGDQVLKAFAEILEANVRPYDTVARFGGEEFVLLSVECDKGRALRVLERIRAAVEATTFEHEGNEIHLTFSAGVADVSDVGSDLSDISLLVEIADRRLYEAKSAGRDRIVSA